MIKKIEIPDYIRKGITSNDIGFPHRLKFWGADFETYDGKPYSFQVCGDDLTPRIFFVNENNVLDTFLDYFEDKILEKQVNICYFHNLNFDMAVLLYKFHREFLGKSKVEINYKGVHIEAVMGGVCFLKVKYPDGSVLNVYDTFAFIKTSLKRVAEILNFPVKKNPTPKGLGEKKLKSKEFYEYAKKDALMMYYFGKWIIDQHREYNLKICLSISQFSARVFRHYYMRSYDYIPFPPDEVIEPAILSYHGGKNGFYYDTPVDIKNCIEIDINSAYPYAMTKIPNFNSGGDYIKVSKFTDKYEGIYKITGEVFKDKYPIIFTHDFKPVVGKVKDLWITSYELRSALKFKEVKVSKLSGFVYKENKNCSRNPLKNFVLDFWKKKDEEKNPEKKLLYKLILNSLYGKFIQTVKQDGEDDYVLNDRGIEVIEHKYLAGGLFNPFIATLITGFTRSYLHELEHKYKAVHSSTDSIKTLCQVKNLPEGLGGLKKEVEGRCIILRNKLYLHYNKKGELKKYALHGFTGDVNTLLKIIDTKNPDYSFKKILKVREALRQELEPLKMLDLEKTLNVDVSKIKKIS